jgi:hypothetical protein
LRNPKRFHLDKQNLWHILTSKHRDDIEVTDAIKERIDNDAEEHGPEPIAISSTVLRNKEDTNKRVISGGPAAKVDIL